MKKDKCPKCDKEWIACMCDETLLLYPWIGFGDDQITWRNIKDDKENKNPAD